ncbi:MULTISPECIES: hypothetical protein [unclassified Pseudomonas]|uniref:hypothetical protein n=1 Tax=unclassified Pseudomonas TaxID=196821 RepID=UPI001903BB88|nr:MULTISPECIES: hypothetical protein [unclassified Pseudomonas]
MGNDNVEIVAFLFFYLVTLYFIWTTRIAYGKKTLAGIGKGLVGVFIAIIALGFMLKGLAAVIPGFTKGAARHLMGVLGISLVFIWGMRFMLVAMSNMFAAIMGFHKTYNADNYRRFSPVLSKMAPGLFVFMKVILSLGCIVIYYGIWLAK